MILGVHHVQITIPQHAEAEARAFYVGILGLTEVPKPGPLVPRGGFWLQVGAECVHVGAEDSVDRNATKAHVAYTVTDLDFWRRKLTAEGIEILDGVRVPIWERFEFRDPFGNRVEMVQPHAD